MEIFKANPIINNYLSKVENQNEIEVIKSLCLNAISQYSHASPEITSKLPLVKEIHQSIIECKNEINLIDERFSSIFQNNFTKHSSNISKNQGRIRKNKKVKNLNLNQNQNQNFFINNSPSSEGLASENANYNGESSLHKKNEESKIKDNNVKDYNQFLKEKNLNENISQLSLELTSKNPKVDSLANNSNSIQAPLTQILTSNSNFRQIQENRNKEDLNPKTPAFNTVNSDETTVYYDKTKEIPEKRKGENDANFQQIMNYIIGLPTNSNDLEIEKIQYSDKIKKDSKETFNPFQFNSVDLSFPQKRVKDVYISKKNEIKTNSRFFINNGKNLQTSISSQAFLSNFNPLIGSSFESKSISENIYNPNNPQ